MTIGRRIEVRGTVQGVGFRPFGLRLARKTGVRGRIWNDPHGVTIEAFGPAAALRAFVEGLQTRAPAGAHIVELRSTSIPAQAVEGFSIAPSRERGPRAVSIPADLATCDACHAEIFDPGDRRHRYAFTNCTDCGPRFTIATDVPYDRKSTTMADFEMCPDCLREYENVDDRRHHAQPNACPRCGPTLELVLATAEKLATDDPVLSAARLVREGAVVAVKGLGGFHLACDATRSASVRALRLRKQRDEKPFAVMVRNLAAARLLAHLEPREEELLIAPERPIVLVRRRPACDLAREVAPRNPYLGLLLPYTPLHHLLLEAVERPLVMTSANLADEPICSSNDEARRRLAGVADAFLYHDRAIAMRCDDSVARVIDGTPTLLRRSRGFVPRPIRLSRAVSRPILACGAQLKNTFCIAVDDTAYFGPHIGDLESLAALEFFEEAVDRMQRLLAVTPEVVAHDLHPGYLSTRYAMARGEAVRVGVQHHHAHIVSAMAEHGLEGPVLGIAYDGTGAGPDETAWGGEFLLATHEGYERLACFRPLPLAGGNTAIREVWRIAYALLHDAFDGSPPIDGLPLFRGIPRSSLELVSRMIEGDLNAPRAHGVGRYFDAFGALALGSASSSYEGQVAMALDFAARPDVAAAYPFHLDRGRTPLEIDLRPAARAALADVSAGVDAGTIAARFQNGVVRATAEVGRLLLDGCGRLPVVLTGGVFQNALLAREIERDLSRTSEVLRHRDVPPGDGGIALGQAIAANAMLGERG